MTSQQVRAAVPDDAGAMSAVQARSWRVAYRGIVPDSFLDGLADDAWAERWAGSLSDTGRTGSHQLVSTADGQVVAVAAGGPARDATAEVTGELYLIYTDPNHWGRGHGSALLAEVQRRLAADGHTAALLWVAADNTRSIGFYRQHGWRLDGTTKQDQVNGVAFDEARMVRTLS